MTQEGWIWYNIGVERNKGFFKTQQKQTERRMTMKYIIQFWNNTKRKVSYLECDSEEEANTVLNVMERNGGVKKDGVWYFGV